MADLAYVLRHLPRETDERLLSGTGIGDDAAVYQIRADVALVQTVDFFTPIVDDPFTFGQIAAANSLSDVYAVGGAPITALNIVGFPMKTLPASILSEILRGGAEKAHEAGVSIVGGHTIDDEEPKYGLAVTGVVDPARFLTGKGAAPGDVLVLTKPLGTGVIATAHKAGQPVDGYVRQAVRWMTLLNRDASWAMLEAGTRASSDITGFGLLGHLLDLCRASSVGAEIQASTVPTLPGALDLARKGFIPAGGNTNLAGVEGDVVFDEVEDGLMRLLLDPQTSGGLLLAMPEGSLETFRQMLKGSSLSAVIGMITSEHPGQITVKG